MLESVTIFLDHVDELIGVFESEYTGGDFCAGAGLWDHAGVVIWNVQRAARPKSE